MNLRSGRLKAIPGAAMPPGSASATPQADASTSSAERDLTYNVPTSNTYTLLNNNDNKSEGPDVSTKPVKPQPIVVPAASAPNIRSLLVAQKTSFTMRIATTGIKLFPTDVATHTSIVSILKANNLNYFTFSPRESASKKFVLFGLDNYPEEEVQSMLVADGLNPAAVKKMRISKQRFADETNYLVYFSPSELISLSDLRDKKCINYTRVSWAHYKTQTPTVTQCHRCMAYGHGTSNCGMPERCGVCAKKHTTGNCPLILEKQKANQRQINPNKLRCANCNGQHAATFRGCAHREQYIKTRGPSKRPQSQQQQQKQQLQRPQRLVQPPPPTNNIEYPAIPRMFSTNGPPGFAYSAPPLWARTPMPPQPEDGDTSSSYTGQDINLMLNEIFSSLQGCRSKAEQARVILELGIKYFSKFP